MEGQNSIAPPVQYSIARRILARVIDLSIIFPLANLISEVVTPGLLPIGGNNPIGLLAFILVGLVFEVFPTAYFGCTLGKYLCQVRVRQWHSAAPNVAMDAAPGIPKSLFRWVICFGPTLLVVWLQASILFQVVALLVYLTAGLDPLKLGRGFHDRAAGTVVVGSNR